MPINSGSNHIGEIYYGNISIGEVYYANTLVFAKWKDKVSMPGLVGT